MRVEGRFAALGVVAAAALIAAAPAPAHDHAPPHPSLHIEGAPQSQEARVAETSWAYPARTPGTCAQKQILYVFAFPAPLEVGPGQHRALIDLDKPHRPTRVGLEGWRQVDRSGHPKGPSEQPAYSLEPSPAGTTLAPGLGLGDADTESWHLTFPADLPSGDLYLRLFAEWPDAEGCGGSQFGIWTFHLTAEDFSVQCRGKEATIVGTEVEDVLEGTPGDDVIATLGGRDAVNAGAGDDLVCLGTGRDQLAAGPGNDRGFGGTGSDEIAGDHGSDRISGDRGHDFLDGGPGRNRLLGGAGSDTCVATGRDRVRTCER